MNLRPDWIPGERIRFRNLLVELSATRVVIFSTHIIEDISSSCSTMAVINRGEVLFNGTPKRNDRNCQGPGMENLSAC